METIPEIDRRAKGIKINVEELAGLIDHTMLSPYATEGSLERLCREGEKYGFNTVAVNPYYTKFCANRLEGKDVGVDTAVGFPLGQTTLEEKAFETERAVEDGATEVDMVMNIGAFRDEKYEFVEDEIRAVIDAAEGHSVKVIIETGYLTYEQVRDASKLVRDSGADFVKNSTGFGPLGANIPHIHLMREAVGEECGVKAAGGIRNFRDALRMIAAGASRIGASSGVEIVNGYEASDRKEWSREEVPCNLCPSGNISATEVPESVFGYYESKCSDCVFEGKSKDR